MWVSQELKGGVTTRVAMAMAVVLCFLHRIDHICHSLDIFRLVGWDLLDAIVLPVDVFPIGHGILAFAFVCDLHAVAMAFWMWA